MSDDFRMVYRTERDEWRQRAVTAEAERDALLAARPGEVETRCATCGDRRYVRMEASFIYPADGDVGQLRSCPDCGVETPEAAVDELLEKTAWALGWALQFVTERDRKNPVVEQLYQRAHAIHSAAFAKLTAQGWTPPGGTE